MKLKDVQELFYEAAKRFGVGVDAVDGCQWRHTFPSTSGPRGGLGGCMMTSFTIMGFWALTETGVQRIKVCAGVWRSWNGEPEGWQ